MECEIMLNTTPLAALRGQSKTIISSLLNATKVIPSPSGLPRDWRGLADIAGSNPSMHASCVDPTASVLSYWLRSQPTIGQLIEALKELDRWDVIDDASEMLESDAKDYAERMQGGRQPLVQAEDTTDSHVLTVDDVQCIETCGQPQYYDAFLLYDDNDEEFAMMILDKLENEYKMKLCTKDRDLIGGLSFEHEAIMQLIKHRCGRLIVVVSPSFLHSPANHFLLTFAQALGIEQRQRKIIPCVYTNFQLPLQLRYHFVLNFSRTAKQWNFWQQLSQSVRAANVRITSGADSKPKAICPPAECIESNIVRQKTITSNIESPKKEMVKNEAYENEITRDIEECLKDDADQKVVITEVKTSSFKAADEKLPSVQSSSFFSKIFSHSNIAKSLLKKKKKLAKVLAE